MTGGMEKHGRALSQENAEEGPKHSADDEPKDDWVVVPEGMQNGGIEPLKPRSGYSGHWDLTLGWGNWKHTLVSFDWKFEHKHSRECQQAQQQLGEAQEVESRGQKALEGEQNQPDKEGHA